MSISKNQQKLIASLKYKKYRFKHQFFVAEGVKVVKELLDSGFVVEKLFVTEEALLFLDPNGDKCEVISDTELKKISSLKSPNKVLGLFKIPIETPILNSGLIVALDGVNDPGNLGTIIRLCDWFGVDQLICSPNTVDCFNQKVIQSTMGSITRVKINYTSLQDFLETTEIPAFITDMDGVNLYETDLPESIVLIMGNEANGVSKPVKELVKNKLTIPRFGKFNKTESLNVATATSILLGEFRRRF